MTGTASLRIPLGYGRFGLDLLLYCNLLAAQMLTVGEQGNCFSRVRLRAVRSSRD